MKYDKSSKALGENVESQGGGVIPVLPRLVNNSLAFVKTRSGGTVK